MFQRILALAKKEFLSILKDKQGRFTIIVPPLVQLLVFGYAATYDLNQVPYALYDEDGGAAARELAARFSGTPHFRQVARISREAEI
ncbi:MAG: antibiotic ABC transporter permease, partial [Desulfococcaceae bacterium]